MKLHFLAQLDLEEETRQRHAKHYCSPCMLHDPVQAQEIIDTHYNLVDRRKLRDLRANLNYWQPTTAQKPN